MTKLRNFIIPKCFEFAIEGGGEKDENELASGTKSSSIESIHLQQAGQNAIQNSNQPRTASIRSRPTSSRITAAELEVSSTDSSINKPLNFFVIISFILLFFIFFLSL